MRRSVGIFMASTLGLSLVGFAGAAQASTATSTITYSGSDSQDKTLFSSPLIYVDGCEIGSDPITCFPDSFPGTLWAHIEVGIRTTVVTATVADLTLQAPDTFRQDSQAPFSTTLVTKDGAGKEVKVTTTPWVQVQAAYDSPLANCDANHVTLATLIAGIDTTPASECVNIYFDSGQLDIGTFTLLEATCRYWSALPDDERACFRFLQVSTDEVYGSLEPEDPPFTETTPYAPNSPYSASKAAADHLVRAYHHTYGLPTLVTNCSNNYGPLQFPEKLIPLMIVNARAGTPLPVYGDGLQVRDWLYVGDHCAAIRAVLAGGRPGATYNVGGDQEMSNLDVVRAVCGTLAELAPGGDYASLVTFVKDRPGHDRRYAIDASTIRRELAWAPADTFATGIRRTVQWYLDNTAWLAAVTSGEYHTWISLNYASTPA